MKNAIRVTLLFIFFACSSTLVAQTEDYVDSTYTDSTLYIVSTYNGGQFIGYITKHDSRELTLHTSDRGEVTIPKYEIESIKKLTSKDFNRAGSYVPDQIFATRYFLTTNALPIEKGESYALYNLWGPEFQFGVADNFSVGVMTSWIAFPIVFTAKYSIELNEKNSIGIGFLGAHSLWYTGQINFGAALPFGSYTYGTRKTNISLSAGYAYVYAEGESGNAPILSVAGMAYLNKNVTFVFDSFIFPSVAGSNLSLFIPGLRFQKKDKTAFQFGFMVASSQGIFAPIPIPFVSWFRKF